MFWSVPAVFGALCMSFLPLAVVGAGGHSDPWLFNLVLCASGIPVLGAAFLLSLRRAPLSRYVLFLPVLSRSSLAWLALFFCAAGSLDWAVFAWAASLGHPVLVVVLSRLAPLFSDVPVLPPIIRIESSPFICSRVLNCLPAAQTPGSRNEMFRRGGSPPAKCSAASEPSAA